MFSCKVCNFVADRSSKIHRHFHTEKHKRNATLNNDFLAKRCRISSQHQEPDGDICSDSDTSSTSSDSFDLAEGGHEAADPAFPNEHRFFQAGDAGHSANEGEIPLPLLSSDSDATLSDYSDCEDEVGHGLSGEDGTYFPFPNKTVFLLCTLLYSNTVDVSDRTMSHILYIMKELGVPNVPMLKTLKQFRFANWEDMVKKSTDEDGVPFYHLKISSWLAQCLAHPTTANAIIRYPRQNVCLSEQADGKSWMDHIPSLWACQNGLQFRTGQFVRSAELIGRMEMFFEKIDEKGNKQLVAAVDRFRYMQVNQKRALVWVEGEKLHLPLSGCTHIPSSEIDLGYKQCLTGQIIPMTLEEMIKCRCFEGDASGPIVTVPVNLFLDDTSANKSRRWSPIHAVQAQLSGLPQELREKHENVVFLAASERVKIQSLANAVLQEISDMRRNTFQTFDAKFGSHSTLVPEVGCFCLDGAMLSEITNHLGASANYNCAVCKVHVDDALKLGATKSSEWLRGVLQEVEAATTDRQRKQIQRENGVKHSALELRVFEHVDLFRLVTFGSLHWFYLGIVRSAIKEILDNLSEIKKSRMAEYLVGIDQASFKNKLSRETVKYFQSRQGKDFKVLVQVMPFIGDLLQVRPDHLQCLINLALMTRLVEAKSLSDADIQNFDDLIKKHVEMVGESLQGLQRKQKTHSSLHVVEDLRRHGPMPCYKEDSFEKNHGNIRRKLFHQNQLCRSRDTALSFAADMCLQHVITGGFFQHGDRWIQAGDAIRHPGAQINRFVLGRNDGEGTLSGRLCMRSTDVFEVDQMKLLQTFIDWKMEVYEGCPAVIAVDAFRTVVCQSGDRAHAGNTFLYKDCENEDAVGEFVRGFTLTETTGRKTPWVEMCPYYPVEPEEHQKNLNTFCPVLQKAATNCLYIPVQSVVQLLSVIHDCRGGECDIGQHSTYPHYYLNNFRLSHASSLLLS